MNRAVALLVALTGCDQVYNLTRPPVDAGIDAGDAPDAPPSNCDFDDGSPPTMVRGKARSIVGGAFGGDGDHLDLAIGSTDDNAVQFLFNTNGAFVGTGEVDVGNGVLTMATGDLNHDSLADVVAVTMTTANVLFQTATTFDVKTAPLIGGVSRGIAIGDLDQVLPDDLVVAHDSDVMQIVLGNDTMYTRGSAIATTSSKPAAVLIMDIDGDGDRDIIAAFEGSNAIAIYRDTGPNFVQDAPLLAGAKPIALALGVFAGRTLPDLLVLSEAAASITLFRNTGSGGFTAAETIEVPDAPRAMAIADVTADGRADIVVASYGTSSFSILRGTDTFFEIRDDRTTIAKPVGLAVGHFTGNERLDLAVLGENDGFVIHTNICVE